MQALSHHLQIYPCEEALGFPVNCTLSSLTPRRPQCCTERRHEWDSCFPCKLPLKEKKEKERKKGDESQLSQSWGCRSLHFDGVGTVPGLAAIPWIGTQVGSSPGDGDLSPGFGFWALYRTFSHRLGWLLGHFGVLTAGTQNKGKEVFGIWYFREVTRLQSP